MGDKKYVYEYPHPALTTDCVIFGFDGKNLHLLLIERGLEPYKGSWALPGGFMRMDETIDECAKRELKEETGLDNVYVEQFRVFSRVDRDPRERVVTVPYFALVSMSEYELIAGDDAAKAVWFKWDELPSLAFDHLEIINEAKEALRMRLMHNPVAFRLLGDKFKMSQLQRLFELITGEEFDRRNFAKKMLASGIICAEDKDMCCNFATSKRPVQLFRFNEDAFYNQEKTFVWRKK